MEFCSMLSKVIMHKDRIKSLVVKHCLMVESYRYLDTIKNCFEPTEGEEAIYR